MAFDYANKRFRGKKNILKIRKITSLTAAVAFILMLLTSIILYIAPQGRVAYWADWRLWGLTKLVVCELKKQGIEASKELTLKRTAAQKKTSPATYLNPRWTSGP